MKVEGEEAKGFQAVRLDSFSSVPGTLVSADDATGVVVTMDKTGEKKTYDLGPRAIRIMPKHRYG